MIAFEEKPKFDYQIVILDEYNENLFSQTMNRQYFELSDNRIKLNKIFLFKEGYYLYRKTEHIDPYNIKLSIKVQKQTRLEVKLNVGHSNSNRASNMTVWLINNTMAQNVTTNENGFYVFKDLE